MGTLLLLVLLLATGSAAMAAEAPAFPTPGEWPCARRNPSLDARSPLRGQIREPRVAWKHFAGAIDTLVLVKPDGRDTVLATTVKASPAPETGPSDPRWGLTYPVGELAGRQQPIVPSTVATYAHVLPDVPGLQKLEFESGFNKPTVNGQWQSCVGRCFAWKDGAWAQVWQTDTIDMLFGPYPIVGDFDADGAPEVAVLPWYELLILDARTGKVKDRCRFTAGRSYGAFGVLDLDGDGKSELVVQSDFAKHVDVLGYRGGKLSLLWQRAIELDITNPQKILRVHPRLAADVDGDGKQEVLISLYDGTTDRRWHLFVRDGMTGAVKADLIDEHLQGVADVDGDGAAELLTVATSGGGVPAFGTIRVRSLVSRRRRGLRPLLLRNQGGQTRTLWEAKNAGWQTCDPPLPAYVNGGATFGQRDVLGRLVGGRFAAVVRRPGRRGQVALSVVKWEGAGFREVARAVGPGLEGIGLDGEGCLLARCTAPPGARLRLSVRRGQAKVLGTQPRGVPLATPAVAWEQGRPLVITQGTLGREEIVCFHPPSGGKPAVQRWRLPGRGQGTDWPHAASGLVVADLAGDGGRQLLYASAAPSGCARMVAADLAGREVWHHDFREIPGPPPVWNTGGIILWQVGRFTDPGRQDVLVTVRRSAMHSEETALLSGRDGRELWRRNRQISSRGVGGTPFAITDLDGDGLDDAASLHPSILYVLKGTAGKDIVAKDCSWPGVPGQPAYWGIPIAGDFAGHGEPGLLFATGNRSMTGLIRRDGSLAWWDAFDRATTGLPAIGDFDGDGRLEVVGLGYEDGIRCYDAATGTVEWRLPAPAPGAPAGMASADINSDGRDEALFTLGSTLYCLGVVDGQGSLLWKVALPASVGPPAIAEVDGSGHASVLLAGADGNVYCVQ